MFVIKEDFDTVIGIGTGCFKYFRIKLSSDSYFVEYDVLLYNRYLKIYKLLKVYDEDIELFLKVIKYVNKYGFGADDYLSHLLSIELSKSIDKEIMTKLGIYIKK